MNNLAQPVAIANEQTQTVFRSTHVKDYTVFSNQLFANPDLSWKAKGILAYLLSKPPTWQTRLSDIVKHAKDGKDSVLSGLKELKQAGYLKKVRIVDETTKRVVRWETHVFEYPIVEPDVENPHSGFPESGKADHSKYRETKYSKRNDQKITISDENAAPRDLGNFEEGKAMKVAESIPDQPPYGSKPGSSSVAAPPKKKWNPECDQLSHDRNGWLKLPTTSSVVPEHRSAVSRAVAIAVRETQMWLIEQDIREVRVVEGEDGEDWVEYLDGSDLLDVALSKGGELPLQKLRSLAMSQCLITQSEFNSMLSTSFWESVNDLF